MDLFLASVVGSALNPEILVLAIIAGFLARNLGFLAIWAGGVALLLSVAYAWAASRGVGTFDAVDVIRIATAVALVSGIVFFVRGRWRRPKNG